LQEVENTHSTKTNITKTDLTKTDKTTTTNSLENTVNFADQSSCTNAEIKNVKNRIEELTKNEISYNAVVKMLETKEIDTINFYLDNYKKFKINKHNPTGFLIKAIREEWEIPREEINNYYQKPIQSTNFEQRKYDDAYFDSLYDY
jgi:hypothetical protein